MRSSRLDIKYEHISTKDRFSNCNAGLWLDRYLSDQSNDDGNFKPKHFADVTKIAHQMHNSKLYRAFFTRWSNTLKEIPDICLLKAKVKGRMVVGLGAESVLENSIALQRTYGMPYIPGSALKGLASSFAHQRLDQSPANADTLNDWAKGGKFHRELFGTTELSGCVSFYDALYIPGTAQADGPLHSDVITVHHRDYYQGKKKASSTDGQAPSQKQASSNKNQEQSMPPADWDSPDIIPFLSATGHYLVALSEDPNWCKAARTLLANGLTHMGIGAKTSSGYGRMELNPHCLTNEQIETMLKDLI